MACSLDRPMNSISCFGGDTEPQPSVHLRFAAAPVCLDGLRIGRGMAVVRRGAISIVQWLVFLLLSVPSLAQSDGRSFPVSPSELISAIINVAHERHLIPENSTDISRFKVSVFFINHVTVSTAISSAPNCSATTLWLDEDSPENQAMRGAMGDWEQEFLSDVYAKLSGLIEKRQRSGERGYVERCFQENGRTACLNVKADPAAQVSIDGEAVGSTPLEIRLKPGRHLIDFTSIGYIQLSKTVTVKTNESASIHVRLKPDREHGAPR